MFLNKIIKKTAVAVSLLLTGVSLQAQAIWTGDLLFSIEKKIDDHNAAVFRGNRVLHSEITISASDAQAIANGMGTKSMISNDNPVYVLCSDRFNNTERTDIGIRPKGFSAFYKQHTGFNICYFISVII